MEIIFGIAILIAIAAFLINLFIEYWWIIAINIGAILFFIAIAFAITKFTDTKTNNNLDFNLRKMKEEAHWEREINEDIKKREALKKVIQTLKKVVKAKNDQLLSKLLYSFILFPLYTLP
ncbi:MAG: hypothetical protein IJY70_00870 [Clostridia bacterium]|nr:hypothetical protein [Clostridia bacterium]